MSTINRDQLLSSLSPEQRMLISVCSTENSYGRADVKNLLAKPFSWDQLIQLSERHRMQLMLYKNFKDDLVVSSFDVPSSLKEKSLVQTQHVLKLAAEGVRISGILSNKGILCILLKGPFLSRQIYGDAGLRPSRDVDILVLPENIDKASETLLDLGYKMVYPDFKLSTKQNRFYQKHKNQIAFRNSENGCLVELHWRLFGQKELFPIPAENVFAERQELIVGGKTIHVLSENHCFEYLCLHGALHQWFRLHWLRDIAQMLCNGKVNPVEIIEKSKKNGNDRPVEQAIILANLFFGSPGLPTNFKIKRVVISIVNQAVIAAISDESRSISRRISRLRVPFYKMKLKRNLRYKMSSWTILHPNFNDWKIVKLPDSLFFLYFLIRPFVWFYTTYVIQGQKPKIKFQTTEPITDNR